jgi:hypothetical protein
MDMIRHDDVTTYGNIMIQGAHAVRAKLFVNPLVVQNRPPIKRAECQKEYRLIQVNE